MPELSAVDPLASKIPTADQARALIRLGVLPSCGCGRPYQVRPDETYVLSAVVRDARYEHLGGYGDCKWQRVSVELCCRTCFRVHELTTILWGNEGRELFGMLRNSVVSVENICKTK